MHFSYILFEYYLIINAKKYIAHAKPDMSVFVLMVYWHQAMVLMIHWLSLENINQIKAMLRQKKKEKSKTSR